MSTRVGFTMHGYTIAIECCVACSSLFPFVACEILGAVIERDDSLEAPALVTLRRLLCDSCRADLEAQLVTPKVR